MTWISCHVLGDILTFGSGMQALKLKKGCDFELYNKL